MKAFVATQAGGPDVLQLQDLTVPDVKPAWVLVEVKAFGLNRAELHTRLGLSGDAVTFPRVLGLECAGIIKHPSDTDLKEGQTVVALMGGMGRAFNGSYAQYVLVPRSQILPVETTLAWEDLAALPLSYLTAWGMAIEAVGLRENQTALVRGATSSVGRAALAILKDMNCTVLATTRSESKRETLEKAGADVVMVSSEGVAKEVREHFPDGLDGAVDLVGGRDALEDSFRCLKKRAAVALGGSLARAWGDGFPMMPPHVHLTMHSSEIVNASWTPLFQEIVNKVETRRYASNLFEVFPFERLPAAHELMEKNGASGKLVVSLES